MGKGTPLAVATKGGLHIGRVTSIERDEREADQATEGQEVSIRVDGEPTVLYGRHFEAPDVLVSHISRASLDAIKVFKKQLKRSDFSLLKKLKGVLNIE